MKKVAISLAVIGLAVLLGACSSSQQPAGSTGKVIKSAPAGNGLTVSLATSDEFCGMVTASSRSLSQMRQASQWTWVRLL